MTLLFFLKPIYRPIPGVTDDRRALIGDPELRRPLRKRRRRKVYRIIKQKALLTAEPESFLASRRDVKDSRLSERKRKSKRLLLLLGMIDDD